MFEEVGVVLPGRLDARDLLYSAVLGVLFAIRGSLAIASLSSVPVFLLIYLLPGFPRDLWLGIYSTYHLRAPYLVEGQFIPTMCSPPKELD